MRTIAPGGLGGIDAVEEPVMSKRYVFTVEGRRFPLDMLRHDRCYPKTSYDSGLIEDSVRYGSKKKIVLAGDREPTVGRWESFQYDVVEVTEEEV
jgi:hypothetical protein